MEGTSWQRGTLKAYGWRSPPGLSSDAAILYLGNYITEFGVVRRLMDRAKEDARLIIHNVPVIEDGEPTWPAKYAVSFPKAINDDATDSAAYQVEIAQPPGNIEERYQVQQTRQVLTKNQAR